MTWSSLRSRYVRWIAVAAAIVVGAGTVATPSAEGAGAFRLIYLGSATSPVAVIWNSTEPAAFVVQQGGVISKLDGKPLAPLGKALDVSEDVSDGGEQGLLGAAFSADGSLLYVNLTNKKGDTEIREYAWKNSAAVVNTKRLLLTIEQPYSNHNGGHIMVGSDGMLWIGTGDGGSGGDPENRAQNPDSLLGKMIRIDPLAESSGDGSRAYSIPEGNMFAKGGGRPEIWAIGLRNPWRYDFDRTGKRLFIGDVGQGKIEEVSVVSTDKSGANFGWKLREGTNSFEGGKKPAGAIDPITEYSHSDGCSITGGVFYTGKLLPGLKGRYLYGDYCKGWIASVGQRTTGGKWQSRKLGVKLENLSSFNTTPQGEVWVTSTSGTISAISGR
jgi:glucose/arabinose dehydrogenase